MVLWRGPFQIEIVDPNGQRTFAVPVDALPATQSILTLVGGKIVYDAQALN